MPVAKPKLSQLRRIAWNSWDPIRLQSSDPDHDDEYDSYVLRVAALLDAGNPESDAVSYLIEIEAKHMDLDVHETTQERAELTVAAIRTYLARLAAPIQQIEIDASGWNNEDDLWDGLLDGLGAPSWHGHNLDALWETVTESAVFGLDEGQTINSVRPPFEIIVKNVASLRSTLIERLTRISEVLEQAKAEYDMDVGLRSHP